MRVVLLTHYYPPEIGAPQTRIAALARGLAELGDEVTVHTGFPHYPDGAIRPPYRNRPLLRERQEGVRVLRSAVYPAANRGFGRRIADHLSFAASALTTAPAAGAAEVVVAETPPLFLAAAAIAYARSKRAALVLHIADLWPDSAIELGALSSPAAIGAARMLERAAYRASAAIACPTEGIAAALDGRPESAGKTALIKPAVDLDRFDPGTGPAGAVDPPGRPLKVLYAGTVGMAHGLGTLLDAVAELERRPGSPAVEVVIAGDGAEAAQLRERLRTKGPAGARMLGAVSSERIPLLYAESDVAVVLLRDRPLFRGALPTKMLEAMAAGRPIVLSAAGEAARLVEAVEAGLVVPPECPAALADALAELARDAELRRRLGAAGRRTAVEGFGRKQWLRRWQGLLVDAAAGPRAP